MNLKQANDLRAQMGLGPIVRTAEQEKAAREAKRRQAANKAAHAQLQRDLKANRSRNKGK